MSYETVASVNRELRKKVTSTSVFYLEKKIKTFTEREPSNGRSWRHVGRIMNSCGRYEALMIFKEWN